MRRGGDRSPCCHRPPRIRWWACYFSVQRNQWPLRGSGKDKEEKSYLPMCSTYFSLLYACTFTGCMPASMANLKQSSHVPATLTTALLAWTYRGNGMNALPSKGSSCHNVNCRVWMLENTHPDPFNSNTSMKFSSCRLTSSSGGAASAAYTAIISEVRVGKLWWWLSRGMLLL